MLKMNYLVNIIHFQHDFIKMSLRAIAWQPRRLHTERDEVASSFLLAMTSVLWYYFNLLNASLILGIICWISCKVLAPTEALNQFTSSSVPNAENGTKATLASFIR